MYKLGDLVNIKTGKLDANAANQDGIYPFFTCAAKPLKINNYAYDCECALVAGNGDLNVKYYIGKFNAYQRVYIIESKNNNVLDTKFLSIFLDTCLRSLRNKTKGAVIQFIRLGDLTGLKLVLPPHSVQIKIVNILSKVENLIAQRKESIALLDEYLKSVFLEMFGDPGLNIKNWIKLNIKEISLRFSDGPFGSNLKTEHYSERGIQVIRLQNIGINEFVEKDISYVSDVHYQNVLKKYSCYPRDIVIATMGEPNIRACVVPKHIKVAVNKADCVLFRVNPEIANPYFISHLLNQKGILFIATSFIHGQTRSRISSGQLAKISIPVPPLELQNKFAAIVEKVEVIKKEYGDSLVELENMYGSLSGKAFRGEMFLNHDF